MLRDEPRHETDQRRETSSGALFKYVRLPHHWVQVANVVRYSPKSDTGSATRTSPDPWRESKREQLPLRQQPLWRAASPLERNVDTMSPACELVERPLEVPHIPFVCHDEDNLQGSTFEQPQLKSVDGEALGTTEKPEAADDKERYRRHCDGDCERCHRTGTKHTLLDHLHRRGHRVERNH